MVVTIRSSTVCGLAGAINAGNLRLLVDDDGDFTNATIYDAASSNISFAINGNEITVSGISSLQLPDNATNYFTIATDPIILLENNYLAFNATLLENEQVELTWQVPSDHNNQYFKTNYPCY